MDSFAQIEILRDNANRGTLLGYKIFLVAYCFVQWVLHDWSDDECVQILQKCREAVVDEDKGKVIIVESVIEEHEGNRLNHVGLTLDMVMMAHTRKGKERTRDEWGSVISKAGFSSFTVQPTHAVQSVIIAYP